MGQLNSPSRTKKLFKRNKKINLKIKKEEKIRNNNIYEILLLGTGDSGKSTLIKQFKLIYKNGFSLSKIQLFRNYIRRTIKYWINLMIDELINFNLSLSSTSNIKIAEKFKKNLNILNPYLSEKEVKYIDKLWKDKSIQLISKQWHLISIPFNVKYYLNKIKIIGKINWLPTTEDIMNFRIPTTGINKVKFENDHHQWRIIDIGGQRNERRKWISHFENVNILIYVIAINEYNMVLFEDIHVNRMKESIKVFKTIVNNKFFKKKNLILLMNKIDLLKYNINKFPFNDYFPKFKGNLNDFELIKKFLVNKYLKKIKCKYKRNIMIFYTDLLKIKVNILNSILKSSNENLYKRNSR